MNATSAAKLTSANLPLGVTGRIGRDMRRLSHRFHRRAARTGFNAPRRVGAGLLALVVLGGCHDGLRDSTPAPLISQNDARAYLHQALESESPDERRQAINRLGQTRFVSDPQAVDALAVIARADRSQSVRTAAVVALGHAQTREACTVCAKIVSDDPMPRPVAPPSAGVRMEATENLVYCVRAGLTPPEESDALAATGMRLLTGDRSRNVRLAAAELLGYFPRRDVLDALVQALEQRDFGVCHAAERSLMRLTGRSFDHDPQAWRAFLDAPGDPFAERGALDAQLDGSSDAAWWRLGLGSD